jgi:hypothetical protein
MNKINNQISQKNSNKIKLQIFYFTTLRLN